MLRLSILPHPAAHLRAPVSAPPAARRHHWAPALRLLTTAALGLGACTDRQPAGPVGPAMRSVVASQTVGGRGTPVLDQYIVVFRPVVSDPAGLARGLAQTLGGTVLHTYEHAIKGFAVRLPAPAAEALRRNPNVDYVEQDATVELDATQADATWGLDRIDQRDLPLSTTYTYGVDGTGVTVYIIDTGIRFDHIEFGGRASKGFDAVTTGGTAADCNGHGTHVAGTVGGTTYGVAKRVKLVAVRVLDCGGFGEVSDVIAGVDWVTANHTRLSVANMSLGGGNSTAMTTAVANSIADSVVYVAAAGNENKDACSVSPANVPAAITVASSSRNDARSAFSNFGTCVDLFAPGDTITSAWWESSTQTKTISGTSMAAPHLAGAAALYLQRYPDATPAQVASALLANATPDKITNPGTGTPNLLLYTGFITPAAQQAITFTSTPPAPAFVGATYVLTANGGGSGNAVTFSSLTLATCTVSEAAGSYTASLIAAGTCKLAADQAGDATYAAAPRVTQQFTVVRQSQTLQFTSTPPSPAYVDATYALTATGGASGNAVTFSSLTPTTCTVSEAAGSYTVSFIAAGTCTLAADQAGTVAYAAAPRITQQLTVVRHAQSIVFTSTPPVPALVGTTYAIAASGGGSGNAVTFSSLTSATCTVSGATASFIAEGTCTLAADQAGNTAYTAASQVVQHVTVARLAQTITVTSVLPASAVVTSTFPLAAAGGGSGQPVVFASLTPATCTTTGATLTLVAVGTCRVQVTQAGTAVYAPAAPTTLTVTVLSPTQATAALRALVDASPLSPELGRALIAKLDDAIKALTASKTKAACGALADFVSQVQAQRGKAIPVATADAWLAQAAAIQTAVGC